MAVLSTAYDNFMTQDDNDAQAWIGIPQRKLENEMKKIALIGMMVFLAGCTGLMQTGSISKAYEAYENQEYASTLKLITQAENISKVTPELKAELTHLKAHTFSKLGQNEKATTLFEYLKDQHKDSQYGYLAAMWLEKQ